MAISITLPNTYFTITRKTKGLRGKLEGLPGLYLLYSNRGELLYVGKSKNIFSRIKSHLQGVGMADAFWDDIHSIGIYVVRDAYEREIYETYAINTLRPIHNKSKTYFKGKDIVTLDLLEEIEYEIEQLIEERSEIETSLSSEIPGEDSDDDYYYGYEDSNGEQLRKLGDFLYDQRRLNEIDKEIDALRIKKGTIIQHICN